MNLITVVLISFLEDIKPHPKDKSITSKPDIVVTIR